MKKVLALAAILVFTASAAFAQEFSLKNFKFFGEGSFYGYTYENATDSTGITPTNFGGTGMYATLGFNFDIYENVMATFAMGYTNIWGDGSNFSGRSLEDNVNDQGLFDFLRIVEANIAFGNLFDVEGLSVKVGRQYYGDEDSTVMYIGIRRDQPLYMITGSENTTGIMGAISSIDAAAAYYDTENIKANLIYGIFDNQKDINDSNSTLMGGDFKYLNIADMFDAQAYMYNLQEYLGTRNYTIIGLKPTFKMNGLKASVELAKNFAGDEVFSNDDANTNFIKIDASYLIENIGLTPRAMFGVFGGDNKTFGTLGNYVPGLIGGQMVIGGSYNDNQIINVGADYALNKFTFSFDLFNFSSRDGNDDLLIGKYENKDRAAYGTEIDVTAKYAYTENIDFKVGIGHLFGGKATEMINGGDSFDASTLQAGVTYKFK